MDGPPRISRRRCRVESRTDGGSHTRGVGGANSPGRSCPQRQPVARTTWCRQLSLARAPQVTIGTAFVRDSSVWHIACACLGHADRQEDRLADAPTRATDRLPAPHDDSGMGGDRAGPAVKSLAARLGRVCSLVSTGAVLAFGLIALAPLEASTQTGPQPRSRTEAGDIGVAGRAWELRGVVLAGERRMAVLEHRASGRERIFAIGDVLTAGVVIARISEDRVILDAEGRPVTLRLGHSAEVRAPTGRIVPPRSRPPTWPWRGSRR